MLWETTCDVTISFVVYKSTLCMIGVEMAFWMGFAAPYGLSVLR